MFSVEVCCMVWLWERQDGVGGLGGLKLALTPGAASFYGIQRKRNIYQDQGLI